MKALTAKQAQVLQIIRNRYAECGEAPSVREIAKAMGVDSSCTVQRHLEALEKKGHITRERYKYRSARPSGVVSLIEERDALRAEVARLKRLAGEAA